MDTRVCEAIRTRSLVAFEYNGVRRIVEPHCHGVSPAGRELIRGYQVGEVTPSDGHSWRLFDVSKVVGFILLERTFPTSRPGFRSDDRKFASVHCHV